MDISEFEVEKKINIYLSFSGKAFVLLVVILFLLGGCSRKRVVAEEKTPKEIDQRYHIVAKGETLYSISWRYGIEVDDLAKCNRIPKPYIIYPKQVLSIRYCQNYNTTKSQKTNPSQNSSKKAINNNKKEKKVKNVEQVTVLSGWRWPTIGRTVSLFNSSSSNKKGIEIAGKYNQPVVASESGKIVYSGNGLIGYGNLVIVKHNELYLTAYGYNSALLVKEGDFVKAGQQIAKMGYKPDGKAGLHFEIRKKGKPQNPLRYLPKRR